MTPDQCMPAQHVMLTLAENSLFHNISVRDEIVIRSDPYSFAPRATVVERDLARYYALLARERAAMPLSDAALQLTYAALYNSLTFLPVDGQIAFAVEDHVADLTAMREPEPSGGYAPILAELRALSPGAQWCLIDLIEQVRLMADDATSPLEHLRMLGVRY